MRDIFLSYHKTDSDVGLKIRQKLLDAGFTVCIEEDFLHNIPPEHAWMEVDKGVWSTRLTVCVVSLTSGNNIAFTVERSNKPLCLILVDKDKDELKNYPPHKLFDIRNMSDYVEEINRLINYVKKFAPTDWFHQYQKFAHLYSPEQIQLSLYMNEMKEKVDKLLLDYQHGKIDDDTFQSKLSDYQVIDLSGNWWALSHKTMDWYYYDYPSADWVQSEPPVPLDFSGIPEQNTP